jgi:DNA-binding LacI/PurR family transcriptional regulator
MPKKVFDSFFHTIVRDIKNGYQPGEKFLSIRDISARYKVSVQTAQRGVKRLEEYGYISVKRRAGITIEAPQPRNALEGYKITVVSAKTEPRFNDTFYKGIREVAKERGVEIRFEVIKNIDVNSLGFGEYLLSLNTDGIIALSFRSSALPFYHVLREGLDIVTDIIIDELPILPSVQTDNLRHAREAGQIFLEKGYRNFLIVGYASVKRNRRYEGVYDVVRDNCEDIQYVCLSEHDSITRIDNFLDKFNRRCAIFSADYSANYVVGAKLVQHGIEVKNDNFLVYDCENECFMYTGLKPVRKVALSILQMGRELCNTLIYKRENGVYPLPLQRKI